MLIVHCNHGSVYKIYCILTLSYIIELNDLYLLLSWLGYLFDQVTIVQDVVDTNRNESNHSAESCSQVFIWFPDLLVPLSSLPVTIFLSLDWCQYQCLGD